MGIKTPVLLIIFNRPDTTERVFSAIRQAQPRRLFVAADGPREGRKEEQRCRAARQVVSKVDWDSEVKTLYQEKNLGCGLGPVTAMNWFFENVEEGIILEDDCLPHPDFFRFCEELLDYYRDNERIMHISGNNFQHKRKRGNASYYYSAYTHTWGWATWRRAWKHYNYTCIPIERRAHIWDIQWEISVRASKGLSILPNVNLVSNIGHGHPDATHTKAGHGEGSAIHLECLSFPLVHPQNISVNKAADRYTQRTYYPTQTVTGAILSQTMNLIPAGVKRAIRGRMPISRKPPANS